MTREIRDVTRDKKLWRTFFISPGELAWGARLPPGSLLPGTQSSAPLPGD